MVLSGHSVGSQIWGDDNGSIRFSELDALFELFPAAAAQVEHLMLSACYAGGESRLSQFHDMFGQVQSIWGYHGSSPGTWSGAMDHMTQWEGATRADSDVSGVDPGLAAGLRKAENVSTWNTADGYQGDRPMTIHELESQLRAAEPAFTDALSGAVEVTDAQSGPLRSYYNLVQRALSHTELDEGRMAELEARRDVTIRLLYFSLICQRFQEHHRAQLEEATAAAGVVLPDLSTLTRAEVLDFISTLEAAGASGILSLLQQGLRDLSPAIIPTSWV